MPTYLTLPLLEVDHGVANKDSKTTPQEESNITMLPSPEPVSRFFGFLLDLSLQVEVLPGWALDDAPNGDNGALGRRRHHHQQEHRKAFS